MREAKIILPTGSEQPVTLDALLKRNRLAHAHRWLRSELLDRWGGYTELPGKGAWRDGPRDVLDNVLVYYVATGTSEADACALHNVAREACRLAEETAIYVRHASGDVEIIRNPNLKEG